MILSTLMIRAKHYIHLTLGVRPIALQQRGLRDQSHFSMAHHDPVRSLNFKDLSFLSTHIRTFNVTEKGTLIDPFQIYHGSFMLAGIDNLALSHNSSDRKAADKTVAILPD